MTDTQKTEAYQFFIVAFGAVTGVEYMNQLDDAYGAGMSTKDIVNVYTTKPQFTSQYPTFLTNEQFAQKLIANVVGTSASAQALAAAEADVVGALNAGWSRGDVIFQIFSNLAAKPHDDAEWGNTAKMFANKVAVAQYLTEVKMVNTEDLGKLAGYLANVTAESDTSSPETIEQLVGSVGDTPTELTLGKDKIVATEAGLTFTAGLEQASTLGNVSNTLESGDSIIAKGEGNTLKADLTLTTTGGVPAGPAISATTENIQKVVLRAQTGPTDQVGAAHNNQSSIDAENMKGVKEWWTDNSRATIQIEDVRTRPEDTLIGMRSTDPEVGFRVYFDPEQLKANGTVKNSALTLTLDKISNPGDLSDNVFNGVKFTLGGKSITLQSDAIGAATTHAELLAALEAAAADNADLAGVTAKLNADNTITLTDAAGKAFGTGSWLTPTGDIPAAGDFKWNQKVGEPERGQELITTQVELDNVGRTSKGGNLDIGSLGDGGVEKFNVTVDRDSWLNTMRSSDHLGKGGALGDIEDGQNQYLQEVHLSSKGANGNLKVGTTVVTADGRLANGLTDVKVVDGSAFKGNLNLGITLNGGAQGSVGRYLDKSTQPVEFNYTGSAGKDVLNFNVDANVANHVNFVMNVNAGAGDDRVILTNGGRLNSTSVDGGEGNNTIVMNANVGMAANGSDSFKSFKNFQNYEVEGGNHNFTGLDGVKSVTVATFAGTATTLRNLPTDLNTITVTGKNQTFGAGNTNNNQLFNGLTLEAAKSDTATIKLDNTALVNGRLVETSLNVNDQNATNLSAVRTLNVESHGISGANTGNYVGGVTLHPVTGAVTGMGTDAQVAAAATLTANLQTAVNNAQIALNAAITVGDAVVIAAAQAQLATAQAALANNQAIAGTGINAAKVSTFNFSGDHAMGVRINEAANPTGLAAGVTDLKVDATGMTGKFDLAVSTAVINRSDLNKTVNLKGGAGTNDTLVLSAGLNTTAKTTVAGFETISFNGNGAAAPGGKLGSKYDAVNTSGVNLYKSNGGELQVLNLKSVENVELGSFTALTATTGVAENVGDHQWFKTTAVSSASTLNLTAKNAAGGAAQEIATDGFKTVNLKLDVADNAQNTKAFNLDLSKVVLTVAAGNVVTASTLNAAVAAAGSAADKAKLINNAVENLVVTGGTGKGAVAGGVFTANDTLNLNTLSSSLKTVDVSGYKGTVTATIGNALTSGVAVGNVDYANTGNTTVKVGAYGINVADTTHAAGASHVDTVTAFVFTTDAFKADGANAAETWKITGFQGINAVAADAVAGIAASGAGSLSNLTILDLSALGIKSITDLQITQGTTVNDTVISANNSALKFHIDLTGVNTAALGQENFKFAV